MALISRVPDRQRECINEWIHLLGKCIFDFSEAAAAAEAAENALSFWHYKFKRVELQYWLQYARLNPEVVLPPLPATPLARLPGAIHRCLSALCSLFLFFSSSNFLTVINLRAT